LQLFLLLAPALFGAKAETFEDGAQIEVPEHDGQSHFREREFLKTLF
jgi:hypothetical protein